MAERFNGPFTIRYLNPEESLKMFLLDDDEWPGMVHPELGVIYVESDSRAICYICPCNGSHPDTSCTKWLQSIPIDGSRGWKFEDKNGVPTVSPSVFRAPPNGCHYFITNGMVRWC
jgi:hypothetical protein